MRVLCGPHTPPRVVSCSPSSREAPVAQWPLKLGKVCMFLHSIPQTSVYFYPDH